LTMTHNQPYPYLCVKTVEVGDRPLLVVATVEVDRVRVGQLRVRGRVRVRVRVKVRVRVRVRVKVRGESKGEG
jgi:hypothetical protein